MQCGAYQLVCRVALLVAAFSCTAFPVSATEPASSNASPSSATTDSPVLSADQASYAFGVTFGEQLRRSGVSEGIVLDALTRGVTDAFGGKKLDPGAQQQLAQYVRHVRDVEGARNKAVAGDYLANNAKAKGIKTTPSGLQYRIVTPGKAKSASAAPDDEVTVQYTGKLLDGTEFDSSFTHGGPSTFQANHTLKGWQEALKLMKPGSKWQLFIPPDLGYGANPPPGVPPGSLLVYDVELVGIQPASARAERAPEPEDHHDE